jgi:hypothetical protein
VRTITLCLYLHTTSVHDRFAALPDDINLAGESKSGPSRSTELTLQDPNGYFIAFTQPSA